MKLTGKLKRDFINWMCKNYSYVRWNDYETMPTVFLNALIIEYLDSVRVKILPRYGLSGWYCEVKNFNDKQFGNYKCYLIVKKNIEDYETRPEAINAAIEKANEIINKLKK